MSAAQERLGEPYFASSAAEVAAVVLLSIPLALATAWRPIELLVGLVAFSLIAVSMLRVEIAVLLLLALAPLEGAFAVSENAQLSPTKVIGLVCVGSFLVNAFATRRRLLFDSSHILVLLLLAFAVVSTAQARDTAAATSVTLRYASFVALFLILTQLATGEHRLQRRIAWVLTAASAITGLLAMRNFVGGETYLATLSYGDPNDTAYFLATTLPLGFWLLGSRTSVRPVVLVMIGTIGAAILLSFSRGALVGLAVGGIWHAFTHRRHLPVLLVGALVGFIVAVGFARSNPAQVETGFELKNRIASENVESRLENWKAATTLASTHPIGVGPGNFESYYFEATGRPPSAAGTLVVHNTYLDIAAELGVAAMALFLAYLVLTFRRLTDAQKHGLGPPGLASALTTSLIVAIVGGLFLSEQYNAPLWVIGALTTALVARRFASDPADR